MLIYSNVVNETEKNEKKEIFSLNGAKKRVNF